MPALNHLILVKHSLPEITPGISAHDWRLSEEGRRRCRPLAEAMRRYLLQRVISSPEPKALETAQHIAEALKLPHETEARLHEHLRRTAVFGSLDKFNAEITRLFTRPEQLVFGEETAGQACRRFAQAITDLLKIYPGQNLAVVAHGTVISLFVAQACQMDGLDLWHRLGLPAWIALQVENAAAGPGAFHFESLENLSPEGS